MIASITPAALGLGIGWRGELASAIARHPALGFVELMAEDCFVTGQPPPAIHALRKRGVKIIPHGVGLSLGSAAPVERWRVQALADLASQVDAPLVSEHLAFVRGGGLETGHLLPLPRTHAMLDILIENIRQAQSWLPVPLALENIATLFEWPNAEMDEATFLTELLERTDVMLLLDIENVYANARNHNGDAVAFLDRIPLERVAYVHIAGGVETNGLYHDTHAHAIPREVLTLLAELHTRAAVPGVMLERDDRFPDEVGLRRELDAIAQAMQCRVAHRSATAQRGGSAKREQVAGNREIANLQADLVRALVAQGLMPAGFDENRLRAVARSLISKRREALTRVWPSLVHILGNAYVERFTRYAQDHPLPPCSSPLGDGRAFLRWLDEQGQLNDEARLEAMTFDLRFVSTPRGLRKRNFALKTARMRDPAALRVALRVPWLGERWWRIPWCY